jgi:hypothetical protein
MQRLLANDQNIATTAHTLGVHANTVRHRVKRFQEITNTRITDHQTTIELWWALHANLLAGGQKPPRLVQGDGPCSAVLPMKFLEPSSPSEKATCTRGGDADEDNRNRRLVR